MHSHSTAIMIHDTRPSPLLLLLGWTCIASASSSVVVIDSPLPQHHHQHLLIETATFTHRQLDIFGDFATVNEVFKDAEFAIEVADPIEIDSFAGSISVQIDNLVCRELDIGDVTLSYDVQPPEETVVSFTMNGIQLDTQCTFDYSYDGPIGINGKASASLLTTDNLFNVDLLLSQPEAVVPPNNLVISNCSAT